MERSDESRVLAALADAVVPLQTHWSTAAEGHALAELAAIWVLGFPSRFQESQLERFLGLIIKLVNADEPPRSRRLPGQRGAYAKPVFLNEGRLRELMLDALHAQRARKRAGRPGGTRNRLRKTPAGRNR